jgi:hypothetical protein
VKRQILIASAGLAMVCLLMTAYAAAGPDALTSARDLWSKTAAGSYSYVFKVHTNAIVICAKRFPLGEARVTVLNGRVTRVASMNGEEFPAACLRSPYTIEWLFEFIQTEQAKHDGRPNPETKYDATYGFPAYVDERDILDGSSYSIEEFRVLK